MMKKRILSLTLVMAMVFTQISFISVFAETTEDTATQTSIESAFTDENFLDAVREVIGKTDDEPIYPSDVEDIEELDVIERDIASLDGIEYFTGLKTLYCYDNHIESLDLSGNVNLEYLDCSWDVELTSLNISNNLALEELECNYTNLTEIDVTKNVNLKRLICYDTLIRELNIENNPLLEELDTYETLLTNLDVTKNPNLKSLSCACNYIASTDDIIGLEEETLDFFDFEPQNNEEPITELFNEKFLGVIRDKINKPNGDIYQSDVEEIKTLEFHGKGTTNLDGLEHLKSLETLNCMTNGVQSLHLYTNKMLKDVNCTQNEIESLDFSGNKNLETIKVVHNELKDVDISKNTALTSLDVSTNQLTNIDLSKNTALTSLDVSTNQITDIDLSNNTDLADIDVSNNQLLSIDLSNNDKIKSLNCTGNLLSDKYDISLPDTIDIEDFDGVENQASMTSENSNFKLVFYPQNPGADGAVMIKENQFNTPTELYVKFKTAMNTKTFIYMINSIDLNSIDGITPDLLTGTKGMSYSTYNDVIDNLESLRNEAGIESIIPDGIAVQRQSEADTTIALPDSINGEYVLYFVQKKSGKDAISSACILKADTPRPIVKDIQYNNNYDTYGFVDAITADKPSIKTHGWSNKKTEFMVQIELPIGFNMEIEEVYLILKRDDVDTYHNNKPIYDEIPLNQNLGNGIYKGGKTIGYNQGTKDGDMYIKCTYKLNDVTKEKAQIYHKIISYYYDPSGYVYEAVPSNRLSDVKTTLYKMDNSGEGIEWDCEESGQSNPIYTDKNGRYEWFVPMGFWRVKAEKAGYEIYESEWLEVPPPQMDVNFAMISKEKPSISEMYVYPDVIEIHFNKYVYADDVKEPGNIVVSSNGNSISGNVGLVDPEFDTWQGIYTEVSGGTGNRYVSKIRFFPENTLTIGDNVTVCIDDEVRSYAGVVVGENCEQTGVVKIRPETIATNLGDTPSMGVGNKYTIFYSGEYQYIEMKVTPVEASRGKKLLLASDAPWYVSVPNEVTVNEDGIAQIPLKGELPGEAKITMSLENSNLTKTIDVNVVIKKK